MKKFIAGLILSLLCLTSIVNAQEAGPSSNSLQNQASSVQGTSNTLQSGESQLPQGSKALDRLTKSNNTVPLGGANPLPAPQSTNGTSGESAWQTLLIVCLVLGAGVLLIIVWGIVDSKKSKKPVIAETIKPRVKKPKNPSKKKSRSKRRKR